MKEEVELDGKFYVADGTVWTQKYSNWYRLNTDTYEWEDVGAQSHESYFSSFCGKYIVKGDSIIDWVTGEEVFNCKEAGVYPPASADEYRDNYLCYFGGDQYLGYSNKEYRWVNLKDLTMSDPLPFPNKYNSASEMVILDDTYCAYYDIYGWFLWNYNTGEEETIVLFEQ